jgi:glucokinase
MGRPAGTGARVVGLDIGGSKVHGVLLEDDEVRGEIRLPARPGADGVVDAAVEAVRLLAGTGPVDGVGLGLPGVVAPGTGVVEHAVNLGIVRPEPVGARLSDRLAVPVVVENDLTVAALGAARVTGLGDDLAYLALGTGVAAGLLLDGHLRRGHRGAAGEIGHVPYVPDGHPCACGQRGCLEMYASGSALDAVWTSRTDRPAPADLFAAAAEGDARAVALRDRFADAVAAAVQILVLTTDVRRVVLGGGVSHVGEPLLTAVVGACRRRAERSPFLTSLDVAGRVLLTPAGVAVAPLGAALALAGPTPGRAPTGAAPGVLDAAVAGEVR